MTNIESSLCSDGRNLVSEARAGDIRQATSSLEVARWFLELRVCIFFVVEIEKLKIAKYLLRVFRGLKLFFRFKIT